MPETERDFLTFAHHLYAQPGVADTCLWLQDQRQLDVMMILFCLWAGHRHGTLTEQAVEQLCTATDPWRSTVIQPLRTARRWLKQQPDDGTNDGGIDTLRTAIKDSELLAEELQGRLLEHTLNNLANAVAPGAGTVAARANLLSYFTAPGTATDASVLERSDALLHAAQSCYSV